VDEGLRVVAKVAEAHPDMNANRDCGRLASDLISTGECILIYLPDFWRGFQSVTVFCPNGMEADEYQGIITRSQTIEQQNHKYGQFKWYFIQEGTLAHQTRGPSEFLAERCLILPGWPLDSSELNPVETV
jgi:hypothetical protein